MSKSLSAGDDQDKLLGEATKQVETHAFEMKTCLDNGKMMDALKHASTMLGELRTSLLSPRSYYELYISVSDQLHHLEQFLLEEFEKGKKMSDLYELVQYAGNIIPRLYLLVTVGTVYIKSNEGSRRDILRDLVEMCRGVQHPLRGLFLRNYLLQCTRNLLPDTESDSEKDGTVQDSIQFILHNYSEMNKLWVRMQHQGHTKEKDRREKERLELRILVGTNLVRLSQLEGVDSALYQKSILPHILEQVVKCRDAISQEYLMECIIQVFPDENHLLTLNPLLQTCAELLDSVNVKRIIIALVDRLASYAHREDSGGIPSNIKLFDVFQQEIAGIIQSRPNMDLDDSISLYLSLINLAIRCYPEQTGYVDSALQYCVNLVEKKQESSVDSSTGAGKQLMNLLKVPLDGYDDVLTVLKLEHFHKLIEKFDFIGRRSLAVYLLQAVLDKEALVTSTENASGLFELLSPLLKDQADQPAMTPDPEDFAEEQLLVARLVHLFRAPVPDQQYLILNATRKLFCAGGDTRIVHTLPALIFATYKLVMCYKANQNEDSKWEAKCEKIFKNTLQTILVLSRSKPETSMRLYLQGALCANSVNSESTTYEFLTQAFTLYEEEISDSREQVAALNLIVGSIEQLSCLTEDNHAALRSKCAVAASRLLKKPDQCRCVGLSAHLFWSGSVTDTDGETSECRDGKRVMECLKKSGRIASQCTMDAVVQVQLLVELLNTYMFFKEKGNTEISVSFIKSLVDKIRSDSQGLEEGGDQVLKHFENTLEHIKHLQADQDDETYNDVSL